MEYSTLDDIELNGRTVLTRVDLNVPARDGRISDATRIDRVVPTVREILANGGKPVLMAHFGRPEGRFVRSMSLRFLLPVLEAKLGVPVSFAESCVGETARTAVERLNGNSALLLENVRFHSGETANDPEFVASLAVLGDIYCNDAFSASHRAHASTEGLARQMPACAGRLLQAELTALEAALGSPDRPLMAIVGGAKVSTKLTLLDNLIGKVDHLVIGGGMANTFLAANGLPVGRSLAERGMVDSACEVMRHASSAGCDLLLPTDITVARSPEPHAANETLPADACPTDAMILDVGPKTAGRILETAGRCRTLIWNGPLGAFETPPFDASTLSVAKGIADLTRSGPMTSVAGGGDTVAAVKQAGVADRLSYVSTAGGAFLEWMEGRPLPGVAALTR
ncbi:MAG: phosphoglycerate kinase [Rhodobacter sp.]|nr:phosphoglycerate kinase [Rhodobacter sp.]MCY4168584.1 phosphoglycerate kinase [Rhodobacter sp.]MCY4242248.1 phosphoglycerate kinase [Rhodobacter sp.]